MRCNQAGNRAIAFVLSKRLKWSDERDDITSGVQAALLHMPGLCLLVEIAYHFYFAIRVCPKQNDVKLDILLVGVHLAIAVHDLELATNFVFDYFIRFNEP